MFKILLFGLGLAGGAAGTATWLLGEPDVPAIPDGAPFDYARRFHLARERFDAALTEGKAAGAETEKRLRRELGDFQRYPNRPAVSA